MHRHPQDAPSSRSNSKHNRWRLCNFSCFEESVWAKDLTSRALCTSSSLESKLHEIPLPECRSRRS
eukprot:1361690-Rhodomonas_salina.2